MLSLLANEPIGFRMFDPAGAGKLENPIQDMTVFASF